jgi:hypothetical protein
VIIVVVNWHFIANTAITPAIVITIIINLKVSHNCITIGLIGSFNHGGIGIVTIIIVDFA